MDDSAKLAAITQYLRRTYYVGNGQWNVAALQALATAAFASATEEVVITATGGDLGTAQGQFKFDKALTLLAVETLLAEVDPDNTPAPPPTTTVPDHSARHVEA